MILSVLIPLVAFVASVLSIECPSDPSVYLTTLYDSLGGDSWRANNWFSSSDYCTWDGVTCDNNNQVIFLDLSEFGLTGQLPAEIGCFPYLKSLLMNRNNMTSTIPSELCQLENLKYLQMDQAGLTGNIPTCICGLQHVQYFYADNNALTGPIPTCVANMTYLREMHFQCNSLTGNVPTGFLQLAHLEELHLRCNEGLVCSTITNPPFIYQCGMVDCDQCPNITPGRCPEFIDTGECGIYRPRATRATTSTRGRK